MINSQPNITKYANNLDNIKILKKAIASPVFGGSVLIPVAKKGYARLKKNPLESEINGMNTEVIFGGGYYQLPNIRESATSSSYYDI